MVAIRRDWKLLLSVATFVLCVAPTIISYRPYAFTWDDTDYLTRSITVSRSLWAGDIHGLGAAVHSVRPPIMTLLGLPWKALASWETVGKCFITLNALTSFFVALSLYFMLRLGMKPFWLAIASSCVLAALGPFPAEAETHIMATGFMADSLFAWNALAAMLLIPYEGIALSSSTLADWRRGLLWAIILLTGAITKASYFYFLFLIVPIPFAMRWQRLGRRSASVALASLAVCSSPVAFYWLRYGSASLLNGYQSSFGGHCVLLLCAAASVSEKHHYILRRASAYRPHSRSPAADTWR
jgi:hypothetical protein